MFQISTARDTSKSGEFSDSFSLIRIVRVPDVKRNLLKSPKWNCTAPHLSGNLKSAPFFLLGPKIWWKKTVLFEPNTDLLTISTVFNRFWWDFGCRSIVYRYLRNCLKIHIRIVPKFDQNPLQICPISALWRSWAPRKIPETCFK